MLFRMAVCKYKKYYIFFCIFTMAVKNSRL